MLSGLQLSVIMHLKQQRAKRNEAVMVKIYRKENVWKMLGIFADISDISIVVGEKKANNMLQNLINA